MKNVASKSLYIALALAACRDDPSSKPEGSPEDVKLADDVIANCDAREDAPIQLR